MAIAPHHDGGPVATAAALHLAASVPNFFIQHVPLPADPKDREMRAAIVSGGLETPRDGFLQLPTGPGLGHSRERNSTGEISCGVDHFWHSAAPAWRSRKARDSGGRLHRLRLWFAPQPGRGARAATLAGFEPPAIRSQGHRHESLRRFADAHSDRPYVFVKLETNQGLVGWGEGTLEGKAGAVMACINDFRDFLIGADPMQVEHIWQSMYVHSFYRAGPVIGSAISGIDQALWDIRGKALGMPVYKLLGGPLDPRGVRGYYHADGVRTPEALTKLRETAIQQGVSCFKTGIPGYYEWIETRTKISAR